MTCGPGQIQRLLKRPDADLLTILADEADLEGSDLVIYVGLSAWRCYRLSLLVITEPPYSGGTPRLRPGAGPLDGRR